MRTTLLTLTLVLVVLISCQQRNTDKVDGRLKAEGDSLTSLTQQQLLSKVGNAIQQGGTTFAVDFCHIEAIPLTESATDGFKGRIERISNRNRNPMNALKTELDQTIFDEFNRDGQIQDTLLQEEGHHVYYKRISIAMATCLKCHGSPGDIEPATFAKIQEHYPQDKAKDYALHDLRGLWKVTFER